MEPIISFVIPVYNGEKYIERCVSSILQICRDEYNIEVLVVNDGSTDRTGKICHEILKKDSRLKYFPKENGGVSSARNRGIEIAVGKYIIFVDADDEFIAEDFDALYRKLEKDDRCVLLYEYDIVDENGRKLSSSNMNCKKSFDSVNLRNRYVAYPVLQRLEDSKDYLGAKVYQYAIPRKTLIENQILFDVNLHFAEDMCFLYTVMLYVKQVRYLSNSVYRYYVLSGSVSHSFRMQFWEDWNKVLVYLKSVGCTDDEFTKIQAGVYSMELHYYGNHLSLKEFVCIVNDHLIYPDELKAMLILNNSISGLYQRVFRYAILHDASWLEYFVIRVGGKCLRAFEKMRRIKILGR